MVESRSSSSPPASQTALYGLIFLLGLSLISLDLQPYTPSSSQFYTLRRRSLYHSGIYSLKDSDLYSNLQSLDDIDTSIETKAVLAAANNNSENNDNNNNRCSNLFIYLPDLFSEHGHGSQINTYIMSIISATYLDRSLVLLEPPMDALTERGENANRYAGGSQFGCPIDAFKEALGVPSQSSSSFSLLRSGGGEEEEEEGDDEDKTSSSSSNASWSIRPSFPLGFSRLIQHPTFISHGCSIPKTCSFFQGFNDVVGSNDGEETTMEYKDWMKLYQTGFNQEDGTLKEVTCTNVDGTTTNVVVTAGSKLRQYFRANEGTMVQTVPSSQDSSSSFYSPIRATWASNLGATPREVALFTSIQNPNQLWDYTLGLLNKAGFMKFQPWIARDVELFLKTFDIPLDDGEYSAIHVRRGDKLAFEGRGEVERYWKSKGYTDMNNLPTDYVPFEHYLNQWDGPYTCQTNSEGTKEIQKHNIYIATDDPIVVKQEIDALDNHVDEDTILWKDCHELTFYFNPTDASAFHLNGDGEDGFVAKEGDEDEEDDGSDSCFARYHRNIASIADMMILSKARTFIGEYNSNWGRVIRTMRVRLNDGPVSDSDDSKTTKTTAVRVQQNNMLVVRGMDSYTRTLDTRIAWGSTVARTPGY